LGRKAPHSATHSTGNSSKGSSFWQCKVNKSPKTSFSTLYDASSKAATWALQASPLESRAAPAFKTWLPPQLQGVVWLQCTTAARSYYLTLSALALHLRRDEQYIPCLKCGFKASMDAGFEHQARLNGTNKTKVSYRCYVLGKIATLPDRLAASSGWQRPWVF
jgi:hypothetical protein